MNRKWHNGQFGVESIRTSSEFAPQTEYRYRVFDLREHGVPEVPVIGQVSHWQPCRPSPWHVHERHVEFIYCAGGSCAYECGERRHRLKPGMMFVSRPGEAHRQCECPKGLATYYLHFNPKATPFARWLADELADKPCLFACSRSVVNRFCAVFTLAESGKPRQELRFRLRTAVQSLLLEILDSTAVMRRTVIPEAVYAIAKRMDEHPEGSYPLEKLVKASGLSKSSFISNFKAAHGCPPYTYLLSRRIERAKPMLKRGSPVGMVASCLGFSSAQCFSRAFKSFVRKSPEKWLVGDNT